MDGSEGKNRKQQIKDQNQTESHHEDKKSVLRSFNPYPGDENLPEGIIAEQNQKGGDKQI